MIQYLLIFTIHYLNQHYFLMRYVHTIYNYNAKKLGFFFTNIFFTTTVTHNFFFIFLYYRRLKLATGFSLVSFFILKTQQSLIFCREISAWILDSRIQWGIFLETSLHPPLYKQFLVT